MAVQATRRLQRRNVVLLSIVMALALGCIFEVAIRQMRPDGMSFTRSASGQRAYAFASSDSATVSQWYRTINDGQQVNALTIACGQPLQPGPQVEETFTFTWHGIPIESAWNGGSSCGAFMTSAGGLPDVSTRVIVTSFPEE